MMHVIRNVSPKNFIDGKRRKENRNNEFFSPDGVELIEWRFGCTSLPDGRICVLS